MSLLRRIRPTVFDPKWGQLPLRSRVNASTISHSTKSTNISKPPATSFTNELEAKELERKDLEKFVLALKVPLKTPREPQIPIKPLSESVKELLPLLRAQEPHYITAHIHGKPYLVTEGDSVKLPFLMHDVRPGDVLRLNRASVLGSRDFTLKSAATPKGQRPIYLDERLFVCRATVIGVESEPMRIMEKTKRRQRHVKTVRSKHKYTVLRISELKVNSLEEVEAITEVQS